MVLDSFHLATSFSWIFSRSIRVVADDSLLSLLWLSRSHCMLVPHLYPASHRGTLAFSHVLATVNNAAVNIFTNPYDLGPLTGGHTPTLQGVPSAHTSTAPPSGGVCPKLKDGGRGPLFKSPGRVSEGPCGLQLPAVSHFPRSEKCSGQPAKLGLLCSCSPRPHHSHLRRERQLCLSINFSPTCFPHLFSFLIFPRLLKGLIRKM